jgi:hypothetical protein
MLSAKISQAKELARFSRYRAVQGGRRGFTGRDHLAYLIEIPGTDLTLMPGRGVSIRLLGKLRFL